MKRYTFSLVLVVSFGKEVYMPIYNCAHKRVIALTYSKTQLATSVSEWMQKIFTTIYEVYKNLSQKFL